MITFRMIFRGNRRTEEFSIVGYENGRFHLVVKYSVMYTRGASLNIAIGDMYPYKNNYTTNIPYETMHLIEEAFANKDDMLLNFYKLKYG